MSDTDFQSYVGSYKSLIINGLGNESALKARSFETLVIAERNQSLGVNSITQLSRMLSNTKLILNQALHHLALLDGFLPTNSHLLGWQNEIQEAHTSSELGLICQRISHVALPVPQALA
ncbi:hypothetical protein GO755_39715 [Spirosoma sp. HMF4905]|uniref:Uncharacterized protein n=1 Tax=Spirosoma arboris TaxID=2682092 RepID=A0A7K1SQW4_9BACT|nr:hypothetical protein [Spirosoma arboris]MVM36205.1 hypothetical protein [Spirosoma arboris]